MSRIRKKAPANSDPSENHVIIKIDSVDEANVKGSGYGWESP